MGMPAAKQGDKITGVCSHTEMVPSPPPPGNMVATLIPANPFNGVINGSLSSNVKIMGMAAATEGSTAINTPAHVFLPPGTSFKPPGPDNKGKITKGSSTVKINGKPAARAGDIAQTCDEAKVPGTVVAVGTVSIGG